MRKRLLTILMIFVMTMSFMPILDKTDAAYASTNGHSEAEAVAWAKNMADTHTYCGECVALIQKYYAWLGVSVPNTNANTYADDDHIPSGWHVDNTPSLGAVYVESNDSPGHVSIVVGIDSAGTLTTVDSNVEGSSVGQYNAQYFPGTLGRTRAEYAGVAGKYFVHPDFSGSPNLSGAPVINVGSGVFVIHSAIDDNYCLDIQSDSMDNDANIQLYKVQNNNVQKFRICKWYDEYSCIQSVYSGRWLDVALPIGDNANVKLYYTNEADENDWVFEDAGSGYVYIRNKSGYYLDVQGDTAVNNANIQLYHYIGNNSQKWRLEDVTDYKKNVPSVSVIHSARNDEYCLDIQNDSTENDANIQLYRVLNNDVQKFRLINWCDEYYCIQSVYSGKWLDVKHPIGNNSNVKLYNTNSADENDWRFEDAGNGYVYIRNRTGYYLDLQGDQATDNANIQIFHFLGTASQKWRLEDVTDYGSIPVGVFEIHSALNDNYCLDIQNDSMENDANIQLYKVLNNDVQKFKISQAEDRYCYIQSVYSGKWLDVKHPIGNNSNVKLYNTNTDDEDQWLFEDAGNGYVYIKNKTGYYLDVQGDSAVNNANIQIFHFVGNKSQKWKLVHAHTLKRTPAKAATTTAEGNIEYWTCSECGKFFKDAEGKTEITKEETIIPKIDGTGSEGGENPGDDNPASGSDPDQMGTDGTAIGEGASAAAAEKAITTMENDNDLPGAVYSKLMVRSPKQTTNSIQLKWKKQSNAVKYVIYGNKCGKNNKPKKLASVEDNNTKTISKTFKKVLGKKVRKGTYYKFIVVALDKDNNVVSTSKMIHVATKGGKYCNYKSVTVRKAVINKAKKLRKGKTLKLNAKAVKQSGKLKVSVHRDLKYESSNNKIATVSENGKVTAKRKGSCYIYAYTQNGVFKKIKVTVK